ncbi:MAG TPA: hypothetical protein VJY62_02405 [Bacteroidia bacterium]|nr:hypothetical protein [Bacteroidia bacterium]
MDYIKLFDGPMVKDLRLGRVVRTITAAEAKAGQTMEVLPDYSHLFGDGSMIELISGSVAINYETEDFDCDHIYLHIEGVNSPVSEFQLHGTDIIAFGSSSKKKLTPLIEDGATQVTNVKTGRLLATFDSVPTQGDSNVVLDLLFRLI